MTTHPHSTCTAPSSSDGNHRVVRFLPCTKAGRRGERRDASRECDVNTLLIRSFAKYERQSQEDDYRHRMIVNGLAFALTIALTMIGVWLAVNIKAERAPIIVFGGLPDWER
jgi:hypothetical protein